MNERDFEHYITIRKSLSPNSVRLCRGRYRIYDKWLAGRTPTKFLIEDFFYDLKQKGLTNTALNSYVFMLAYVRDFCKYRELPTEAYAELPTFKKQKTNIVILTPSEIEKILATHVSYGRNTDFDLNFLYTTFTMFLAYTGCRFSEGANLKVKDLDLEGKKATFLETKNGDNRFAHLTEPLLSRLGQVIQRKGREDLVFTNSIGLSLKPQTYSLDLRKRARMVGITKKVHPHLFRHSFATQLLIAGVDVTMVASLLGHKDIQTTFDNYVHLADETLKKATMRHPLIRKNVDPQEILSMVREALTGFQLEKDERFEYEIEEKNSSFNIHVAIR